MLSCKFVSLLLLAFVALAVAGTLQSTRSLKVPVLVAEGGGRIHLETPPSFYVRIKPLQGERSDRC